MAIIKQLKGTADSCALIIKKMESKLDILETLWYLVNGK